MWASTPRWPPSSTSRSRLLHDGMPAIPATLDALVARLLAKDPRRASVLRRRPHGAAPPAVDVSPSAAHMPPAIVDRPASDGSARLIGRDAERAQLLQILEQARSGRGGLVLLVGDAGIGKTRLAEEVLSAARRLRLPDAGRPMLRAGGHATADPVHRSARGSVAADAAVGFSPGDRPERTRAREADARAASPLSRHGDAAGAAAAPAATIPLHECPGVSDAGSAVRAAGDLHRRPAVGGRIDAAADAASGPAAGDAADRRHRRVPRGRGRGARRREGQVSATCWTGSVARRATRSRRRRSRPRSISSSRSVTRARSRCGRSPKPRCTRVLDGARRAQPPARLVRKFADHTGGNPFFVAELFRHLKDEGRLFDARNQWTRDLELDDVEVPEYRARRARAPLAARLARDAERAEGRRGDRPPLRAGPARTGGRTSTATR